jgi:regulatory protein
MKPPRKLDADGLWNYAVRALGSRAHSSGELRAKLRLRAERLADADEAMARLRELGYLDDRRFAENFAATRLENQRLGRARVLNDLRARRVAPAVAEQTIQRVYKDVDETELIEEYLERKLRIRERPDLLRDDKALASAFRRLLRAGFTRGNAVRALKAHAAHAETLEAISMEPDEPEHPAEEQ